jgi:hypothetical protein
MALQLRGAKKVKMEIRVEGVTLRQVDVFKYLGYLLTPSLSPAAHVVRSTERARAATSSVAAIISKLEITKMARLRTYLSAYVESQFYGLELLPVSALDSLCSARSAFVRKVFDLPMTSSHELAVILLGSPPPEVIMLQRMRSFARKVKTHDFEFVKNALVIDEKFLCAIPTAFFPSMLRLVRKFLPNCGTDLNNVLAAADRVLSASRSPHFVFSYVKRNESTSLSFFTTFGSVEVLESFRAFLESKPFPQRRLVILFASSLLRFRFCSRPRELCPLCGRPWLWEHFFNCRFLVVAPIEETSPQTLSVVSGLVERGEWEIFMHYLRFYLLQWCDLTFDPVIPAAVIDSLTD